MFHMPSLFDNQFALLAVSAIAGYLLYRIFSFGMGGASGSKYEKELGKILNSDKHKVKGRFER